MYNPFHSGLVRYILLFRTLTTSSCKVFNFTASGRTYRPLQYTLYVLCIKGKGKWSHYRPSVDQRVGRCTALLFHDRGTRRGWVVSSMPRPHFTHGRDPVTILQEAGWAPGPVWTGGKSRPHRDSIPERPARSQSLYRLCYPAHMYCIYTNLYAVYIHFYTFYLFICLFLLQ